MSTLKWSYRRADTCCDRRRTEATIHKPTESQIARVAGIVCWSLPAGIVASLVLLLAGAPYGLAKVPALLGMVAVGGLIVWTLIVYPLLFHMPHGLRALFGPGEDRLDRFGTWAARNMEMEHEPLVSEDVEPRRREKISGAVLFFLYYGFVLSAIGAIAWSYLRS